MTNAQELERLATENYTRFRSVALRYMKNYEEADDMVQDSFLKAHTKLHLFKGNSKLSTWFTSVLINTCLMKLRLRSRRANTISLDEPEGEEGNSVLMSLVSSQPDLEHLFEVERVRALIGQLPMRQRQVIELSLRGLYHKEIAEICEVSIGTSKSEMHRGKRKLKKWMAGEVA